MINFREMVSEALTADDNEPLPVHAAQTVSGKGFSDIITLIKKKCATFNDAGVKDPSFYSAAWTLAGQKQFYPTTVSRNPIFYDTYPMLDFLFLIKEQYFVGGTLGKQNWTTDKYVLAGANPGKDYGLTELEKAFSTHIAGLGSTFADPLFDYKPASATLGGVHQKIKDDILGSGIVGTKTIQNCKTKGYTIRQCIYLAVQLRQRNMSIVSSIPATNNRIDDFLYQSVTDTNAYLGGSVYRGKAAFNLKRNIKTAISAIVRPKAIPSELKDMVDTLLSLMDSIKSYADALTPPPLPKDPPRTAEEEKKAIDVALNTKIRVIVDGSSDIQKEIRSKLTTMLNHVPGEKDWVGKIQSAAAGMKSLESALGGAKM